MLLGMVVVYFVVGLVAAIIDDQRAGPESSRGRFWAIVLLAPLVLAVAISLFVLIGALLLAIA